MNALKRVKKIIAIGLLANTLYITPIWAQAPTKVVTQAPAEVVMGTQMTARELLNLDSVLLRPFKVTTVTTDKDGNELPSEKNYEAIDTTDEAKEFFELHDDENGKAVVTFTDKGVELIRSMEPEDRMKTLRGLSDMLAQTAPEDQYESLAFADPGGEVFARATFLDDGTVDDINIGDEAAGAELIDTDRTDSETSLTSQESQGQPVTLPRQQQGGGSTAGALSTQQ
jgi:hypothetical protein